MKTRGAKVNGKLVPLNHVLKSGDQVDIITSESAKPTGCFLETLLKTLKTPLN